MKKFKTTILIVEDSPSQLKAINALAQKAGYETAVAQTLSDAKLVLSEKNFNIVLTDIHLNNGENTGGFEGFELLEFIKSEHPEVTPVGMSSDPDVEVYNGAVKRGAVQFVRKPFLNADEFKICIEQSVKMRISMRQSQLMKSPELSDEALRKLCPDGVFIPPEQRDLAQRIAEKHDMVVCITGETGTGKEEIAKLIHRCRVATFGPTPFVPVNCANLNSDLASTLLFGHRKGAFTGADKAHSGFICEANGGILFLDEIHALSLDCQKKLLRVLNDGKYERLGETIVRTSQFQLISASTVNLVEQAEKGLFLMDLYARVMGSTFETLPLRKRKADFPVLVTLMMANQGVSISTELAHKISAKYSEYYWQGNLRQLYKNLKTFVFETQFQNLPMDVDKLPIDNAMFAPGTQAGAKGDPVIAKALGLLSKILAQDTPLAEATEQFEKCLFQATLARHSNPKDAMAALAISRSGFAEKRKRWCLE